MYKENYYNHKTNLIKTCFSLVISLKVLGCLLELLYDPDPLLVDKRTILCGHSASSVLYFFSAKSCNSRITSFKLSTKKGHIFNRNCLSLIKTIKLHHLRKPLA